MAEKYYAVFIGRNPGIYNDYEKVKLNVEGYPNAEQKSYKDKFEAEMELKNRGIKYTDYTIDPDLPKLEW